MISSDVKMALINYPQLKSLVLEEQGLVDMIDAFRFKVGGSIAKIPENPMPRDVIAMNNMEKNDLVTLSLALHTYQLWIVNDFLEKLKLRIVKWPTARQIIIDQYIKQYSQTKMEDIYKYDRTQIYRNINKYIDWYVKHHNSSLIKEHHD